MGLRGGRGGGPGPRRSGILLLAGMAPSQGLSASPQTLTSGKQLLCLGHLLAHQPTLPRMNCISRVLVLSYSP